MTGLNATSRTPAPPATHRSFTAFDCDIRNPVRQNRVRPFEQQFGLLRGEIEFDVSKRSIHRFEPKCISLAKCDGRAAVG